jgi:hypothetical protein
MATGLQLAGGGALLLAEGGQLLLAESTRGWTAESADLFADIVAEFGVEGGLVYNEETGIDCVVSPVKEEWDQSVNSYRRNASVMIECLREDAVAVGLYAALENARPKVMIRDIEFQIVRVENDDPTIAYIELFANRIV